ncbi:MAG: sulfurtransferase TusA family protein [Bacillota bacterium]|nr:sulfurtransferase TusA family protein [Bacillota bacterium]
MKTVRCFGDMCPVPLLKLKHELEQGADEVLMIVDHSCVLESVRDYLEKRPYECTVEEPMNGVWEITVRRTG